jgi:hypothetical protein
MALIFSGSMTFLIIPKDKQFRAYTEIKRDKKALF